MELEDILREWDRTSGRRGSEEERELALALSFRERDGFGLASTAGAVVDEVLKFDPVAAVPEGCPSSSMEVAGTREFLALLVGSADWRRQRVSTSLPAIVPIGSVRKGR